MIHDRQTAQEEGKRIATENECPVWIEYDMRFSAYIIHETPNHIPARAWIVEPTAEGRE